MTFNIKRIRDLLQNFQFNDLFNELGWSRPIQPQPMNIVIQNTSFELQEIAQLSGVTIYEVKSQHGKIPDAQMRKAIHKDISTHHLENLLIFLDADNTQSLWYWVKRDGTKRYPREHLYIKGQPGDLSLGKLEAMVFDIGDFDESGKVSVLDVASRLKEALDVERVTKRFYEDYQAEHNDFRDSIDGIDDEVDRRWYASILLNRLMFIYFLQRKRFIDNGNLNYLKDKLAESRQRGSNLYYSEFLNLLFFEGFAKPEYERSEAARQLLGTVVYLNGGLFLLHPIEKRWPSIQIPDVAFENLLKLFAHYSWNLDDAPGGDDDEISPHILGYIFEKYINQKSFGAYYTRPEITEYLCERTIHKLILEKINTTAIQGISQGRHFDTVEELLMNLDARLCRDLLEELPKISLLDPACGSGAFLVSAMNTLTKIYTAITGKIEYLTDSYLANWLRQAHAEHDSLSYYIKKKIITENLFGVDIMEEGTEIAKLRLFLALVSSVQTVDQLEPLPNIDFNILPGNSLIGLLHVNESRLTQLNLIQKSYHELVEEKNRLIRNYKNTAKYTKDLRALRDNIQDQRDEANANLNELLLDDFKQLGIKYEQATWDSLKNTDGKSIKRSLTINDIASLHPFHWGYEFDQVMHERDGFDIIITNPPWEILKPQAKEFFETHSKLVSKNKMRIEDFEIEKDRLLQDTEIQSAWLEYQSAFPFQSVYFRKAEQYENQISTVNGKKQGTDINLYKLFTEQCYNLLREGGQCGIVIPSGIYTDLGAKQLREMLFNQTQVTGLFCFENNKAIFENVHRSYKFVVLTFEKGEQTQTFPTAFMRHDVKELERFPRVGALDMSVELIRRLSPDSLSVMEFKNEVDVGIARKMLKFPLLGEKLADTWNVALTREFDMTNDSKLFRTEPGPGRLPLYEGKMIHQFTHQWSRPRYWVDEKDGRSAILGRKSDSGQKLDYQNYRLGYRGIGRTTDQRALIVTVFPFNSFAGNSLIISRRFSLENGNAIIDDRQTLFLTSIMNSFIADYFIGQKISANLNMFYIYQLPVPRLSEQDISFRMIVERAAKLICTTPEFQKLWESVMPDIVWSTSVAAIDVSDRAKLKTELDGIIAHLYGLNEEEFRYILGTFPLVSHTIKDAALDAYRKFALEPDDLALAELISKGENDWVEFKVAACCNPFTKAKDNLMKDKVVQAVAAFLNKEGGKVLIGVDNNGKVVGLEDDYKVVHAQQSRQNSDGYQLFLSNTLSADLGKELTTFYEISFHSIGGKDVCCIDVQPSDEPVYVRNSKFYVRHGNGKLDMNMKETMAYIKRHWGR